jgi:sulfate adenylyltransferase subunit 1 (EFTu-like GTPase family)
MGDEPLRRGERVVLRVITQETVCRVEAIERRVDSASLAVIEERAGALGTAEVGELALALDAPLVVEPFGSLGRVVLDRRGSVAGAGILLGPDFDGPLGGKATHAPTDP